MSLEELKELILRVGMGRRDAAEELAELLHSLLQKTAEKPKKAVK
jgi:hypothetical protein